MAYPRPKPMNLDLLDGRFWAVRSQGQKRGFFDYDEKGKRSGAYWEGHAATKLPASRTNSQTCAMCRTVLDVRFKAGKLCARFGRGVLEEHFAKATWARSLAGALAPWFPVAVQLARHHLHTLLRRTL